MIHPKINRIAVPLTLMLKISWSAEFTTRPGKGRVEVSGDGGNDDIGELTSILRTSASIDSSTSAAQIVVEFDEVDVGSGGGNKLGESRQKVKELSKVGKS